MVIGDELEMGHNCAEAFPTGEGFRVDHEADQLSVRRDKGIDLFRELLKIRFLKRATWSNDKDVSVPQQFRINHRP